MLSLKNFILCAFGVYYSRLPNNCLDETIRAESLDPKGFAGNEI